QLPSGAVRKGAQGTLNIPDAEGMHIDAQHTDNYDGEDYPVPGIPDWDTIAWKRIDAYTVETTRKKAGKVISTATRVASKDGKTFTLTEKGVNAKGEKYSNTAVFEKQ